MNKARRKGFDYGVKGSYEDDIESLGRNVYGLTEEKIKKVVAEVLEESGPFPDLSNIDIEEFDKAMKRFLNKEEDEQGEQK